MIDRVMWMLPFVTRSDLEAAAQQADVSMEIRNHFLNKLLHEHGQTGIRKQLQTLWTEWVEKNYGNKQQALAITAGLDMDAATPPDDEDESSVDTAGDGGSGGGGSGDPAFCGLTGNRGGYATTCA
jgi:hypothetical protein